MKPARPFGGMNEPAMIGIPPPDKFPAENTTEPGVGVGAAGGLGTLIGGLVYTVTDRYQLTGRHHLTQSRLALGPD